MAKGARMATHFSDAERDDSGEGDAKRHMVVDREHECAQSLVDCRRRAAFIDRSNSETRILHGLGGSP
eukprot:gene41512-55032_t